MKVGLEELMARLKASPLYKRGNAKLRTDMRWLVRHACANRK
jgi:hypothetical protein